MNSPFKIGYEQASKFIKNINILEFIRNDDFKYLRLLGAFYLRLTRRAVDVFNYLEPLLNDYRRVRVRDPSGNFSLCHMDELVDSMLRMDHMFNIALPRLPARPHVVAAAEARRAAGQHRHTKLARCAYASPPARSTRPKHWTRAMPPVHTQPRP